MILIYFYFLNVQNFKRGSSCEFAKFNIHVYDYLKVVPVLVFTVLTAPFPVLALIVGTVT